MNQKNIILYLLCALFAVATLSSCKETKEDEQEFSEWQAKNEEFFNSIYQTAQQRIAAGSSEWKVIRKWSLPALSTNSATDHIVVKVLNAGSGTTNPLYSDTTHISYEGRLIPSESYSTGYIFEKTYTGEFNPDVAVPVKFGVSQNTVTSSTGSTSSAGVIDGMTTALMNMHVGDYWEVYIPYTLAYGTSKTSSIPAYSTLIFKLYLHDYWHAGAQEKK